MDFAFAFALHALGVRALGQREAFTVGGRHIGWIFSSSTAAGLGSAAMLYPFDIVRQTTVPSGARYGSFAVSTIPYMAIYMGCYFSLRDEHSPMGQKLAIAAGASTLAAAVEMPFDRAKLAISGSARMALITTGLRIPLASLLLVSYDHVLLSNK